jgi:hypothetical protein
MNVHEINAKQDEAMVAVMRAAGSKIELPESLDSVAMATTAVRNVRRRRAVLVVVGGAAGIMVAAAGGLAMTYDAASSGTALLGSSEASAVPEASVAPSPVTSVEPTPEATGPQPAKLPRGWQAAEFHGLSYAMPGDWNEVLADDTVDWMGPGQEVEFDGEAAGYIADTLFMRADLKKPATWGRNGETRRQDLDVPGAQSATLAAGVDPDSKIEWADLLIHQEDGLWYSVHLDFVTEAARPIQVAQGFAESLAFTSSAEEVRAGIEGLQGSDNLPVIEVDRETPSDWAPQELNGMRYAVPAGMSADPVDGGLEDVESWLVPDGVQDGVDLSITALQDYAGYGATMAAPKDAQTFEIEGAGRVQVTLRESEPWYNGATPLDVQFRVWDEDMSAVWDITATLPNTPAGEETALRILGSVRIP